MAAFSSLLLYATQMTKMQGDDIGGWVIGAISPLDFADKGTFFPFHCWGAAAAFIMHRIPGGIERREKNSA